MSIQCSFSVAATTTQVIQPRRLPSMHCALWPNIIVSYCAVLYMHIEQTLESRQVH